MPWKKAPWPANGFEVTKYEYGFWVLDYGGQPMTWCAPGCQQSGQLVGMSPAADHVFVVQDEVKKRAKLMPPGTSTFKIRLMRRPR